MQRIRMSLPYFSRYGWEAEVVTVDEKFSDLPLDNLLMESLPNDITVHKIKGFAKKWTSKIGLGSIALRAMWFYYQQVNMLLSTRQFDLIYFSTTQFPVLTLGAYWKRRFGIPYVIDMQDLWHSDYYQDKPKNQRPPKYWFSYSLNKFLEPIAMKEVGGLISVSGGYLDILTIRYPNLQHIPQAVITFGAFKKDFDIAANNNQTETFLNKKGLVNIVYIGRGGHDLEPALRLLLKAIEHSRLSPNQIHFHFIGTSYAPDGKGIPTIKPLAVAAGMDVYITEHTDRIPYYQTLNTLKEASGLFIPGSDDQNYSASKIYPYIMAEKPLLAVFHKNSSAGKIISNCNAGTVFTFDQNEEIIIAGMANFLTSVVNGQLPENKIKMEEFKKYSAEEMTLKQVNLFNKVINI
ncbi:glycosyltransferase family protein [Pedobacter duraquae]|nr:hypothetical protein [Pedobacter duraquae]